MNATKRASILLQINNMSQVCKDLMEVCYEDDDGYVVACLQDAQEAFRLAMRRLQGESTLTP
jgi:pyruvate/2-oxoacid:ferredoxin oxidoreductase alpha subunit